MTDSGAAPPGVRLITVDGRPGHYIEMCADDMITPEQDRLNALGYTPDQWIALNRNGALDEAYVDDEHKRTPIGKVLSTHLTRSELDGREMLGAGAVVFRDTPKGKEISDGIISGKLKTVSINYSALFDPFTHAKIQQKFLAIGVHSNPKKPACTIYRRQGAQESEADQGEGHWNGRIVTGQATPGARREEGNTKDRGTCSTALSATRSCQPSFTALDSPLMDPKAGKTEGAAAAGGAPAPVGGQNPPAANAATAGGAPAATGTPAANQQQTDKMEIDQEKADIARRNLDAARALSQKELIAQAAHAAELERQLAAHREEAKALREFKESTQKTQAAARWAEIEAVKSQLVAAGFDYDKVPAAKAELDKWAMDPSAAGFATTIAIQNAKVAAAAAKNAADEKARQEAAIKKAEEEKSEVAEYWARHGKFSPQEIDQAKRRAAQLATGAGSTQGPTSSTTAMDGVQQPAGSTATPTGPPAANHGAAPLTAAQEAEKHAQLAGLNAQRTTGNPILDQMRQDLAAELMFNAIRSRSVPETFGRSVLAGEGTSAAQKVYERIARGHAGGWAQPIEVAQGADGTYGTGQIVSKTQPGTLPLAALHQQLQRPETMKDVQVRTLLNIQRQPDGSHVLYNPISKVKWDIEKDICFRGAPSWARVETEQIDPSTPPQKFDPAVLLATAGAIYSSGEGYALPAATWNNGHRPDAKGHMTLRETDFNASSETYIPITGKRGVGVY